MKEMRACKVKAVLTVLLCISLVGEAAVIQHFEREWNVTLNDLTIEDRVIGKDNIFTYAKCSLATGNERNCTVVLEAFHPDGIVYKNKCYSRFHTEKGSEGVNMLQMRAVTNGKIVFSYADIRDFNRNQATAYLKFRVLDTLTCKSHEAKVFVNVTLSEDEYSKVQSDSFWLTSVFPYRDGSIDAFLPYKNLCDGARCKVTFDASGELVGKPVSYLSKDVYYNDVKVYADTYHRSQSAKDYFIVISGFKASSQRHSVKDSKRIDLKLIYAKADGDTKELLHLKETKPIVADVDIDPSGSLSICWSKTRHNNNVTAIQCRDYNPDDPSLNGESFEFEVPYAVKTLKIRRTVHSDVPRAALLVLTDECQNEACETDGDYYVRLISLKEDSSLAAVSAAHNSLNMELSGLNCSGKNREVSMSPAWNHDGMNVCVSMTCQRSGQAPGFYNVYKLVRRCFSMKYLDRPFN